MNFEKALDMVDEAVLLHVGKRLSEVEIAVLKGSWQKQTYETNYAVNYLKIHVGPALWKTLRAVLNEPVTKNNVRSILERRQRDLGKREGELTTETIEELSPSPSFSTGQIDWGEALDGTVFYGRMDELSMLQEWIVRDRCRLVAILGMGGIGKTVLSVQLAQESQNHFEYIIWRSLRNAPPLDLLLADLNQSLLEQENRVAFSNFSTPCSNADVW
jgi:hypothetical protein